MLQKKTKKILIIGTISVILLLVIARKAGWIGSEELVKVNTAPVSKETITETVTASGKVQPETEVKIASEVSGEVVDLLIKEGDVVKKGDLLAKINPEIYISAFDRVAASVNTSKANLENSKSRLKQAESQFLKAEMNFNRNKKLYEDKVISDSEFETIRSSYEVAKAEVDAARQSIAAAEFGVRSAEASLAESKENLNKTSIFAPVDGTISKLSVERGERIVGAQMMAGTEILRLANLNEMEVSVDVSESDIIRVNLGDTAKIEIDAYTNRVFTGVVSAIANSANNSATAISTDQVTNFQVKVRINRDSYSDLIPADKPTYSPFRPGMSAAVEIQTKRVYDVTAVPIQAVTTRDTVKKSSSKEINKPEQAESKSIASSETVQECVFVYTDDGTVKLRPVKTGIQDNEFIQILEGLKPEEVVVIAPYNAVSRTLKDGDKVNSVPKEELFKKE
jgi:HlyD family secretion protein